MTQETIDQWQIPGLSLVIVHDDRIVHLKGYGVAALGRKAPITPETVFPLASCTKPFTTTLLAMLVDDGKLGWNDSVRNHLPFFRLKDPLASERATVRDLLCHRTGLGVHPLLWYHSPLGLEERVRVLATLDPVADFRTEFHYQTIVFGAAGLAGERAAARPWSDLLNDRVLRPLGMTSSSAVQPADTSVLASPHRRGRDGVVRVVPRYELSQPDPAGSVHSTARDLASFLRLHLNGGVHDRQRLVSAVRIHELQQPSAIVPCEGAAAELNPETRQISYGLGWIIQDYRGRKMTLHGGAIDGFRAHLVLIPESRLGIAILSNLDGSLANLALANTLTDLFLEVPPRSWRDEFQKFERRERQFDTDRAAELRKKRPADARPLRPLVDYEGTYEDTAYGTCRIVVKNGALELQWRSLLCPLEHYEGHVFLADTPPFRDAPFEFVASPDGSVASLRFLERAFARKK